MSKQRVTTILCPFCLMDVLATELPTMADLLDRRRTTDYMESQLEAAGHLDWHVEQMVR
jgi:hypothetical protein